MEDPLMESKDPMGDRMKAYERTENSRKLDPKLPVYARIDGRSFSNFTKKMNRPYDKQMSSAMVSTTMHLVEQTDALLGYTQSDEISLVWKADEEVENSSILFDGKVMKLCSILSSMAAAYFAHTDYPKIHASKPYPHFDCRVCQLPSDIEAANMFLWRQNDGVRNAIQGAAQHYFSSKDLFKKSQAEMLTMLKHDAGIDYDVQYPDFYKYGTFVKPLKVFVSANYIDEEHRPLSGYVERRVIEPLSVRLNVYQIEELMFAK